MVNVFELWADIRMDKGRTETQGPNKGVIWVNLCNIPVRWVWWFDIFGRGISKSQCYTVRPISQPCHALSLLLTQFNYIHFKQEIHLKRGTMNLSKGVIFIASLVFIDACKSQMKCDRSQFGNEGVTSKTYIFHSIVFSLLSCSDHRRHSWWLHEAALSGAVEAGGPV